jgi:hypothetical protein
MDIFIKLSQFFYEFIIYSTSQLGHFIPANLFKTGRKFYLFWR